MHNELPELVSVTQACEWLQAQTDKRWTLAQLLDAGLEPYFWLDFPQGGSIFDRAKMADIFEGRYEGMLCKMASEGDLRRLRALPHGDGLATSYATPSGRIMFSIQGIHIPRDELVFKASVLQSLADALGQPQAAAPEPKAAPQETAAQMGARHWQACLDDGLEMPTDTYAQFPRGITRIARREGIKRQTFAKRLDAYRAEKFSR